MRALHGTSVASVLAITRSRTEPEPTALASEIATTARDLLGPLDVEQGIRLIGISGSQLVAPSTRQGVLDLGLAESDEGRERRSALEHAMDAVRERFGSGAVGAGSLVERSVTPAIPARQKGDE